MAMLTWIPQALRAAGLVVVEYPGWEAWTTRRDGLTPRGVVCHHTATRKSTSNEAVARLLAQGRSDLRGPLCQLGLDRDGHYWMIAAGRGNHNGFGQWGNDSIGIEAFNDGVGEPWPDAQIDAFQRGCAVLLSHLNLTPAQCLGHKETDPNRKIDPRGIDMRAFRQRVAALMADEPTPPTPSPPTPDPPATPVEDDAMLLLARRPSDKAVYLIESQRYTHVKDPAQLAELTEALGLVVADLSESQFNLLVYGRVEFRNTTP